MAASKTETHLNSISEFIIKWTLWFGKLCGCIGIAWFATHLVGLQQQQIFGSSLPLPVLKGTGDDLIKLCGAIYLVSR